jgi:glycosyltransferase involved in cell wall biosynthesis
MEAFREGTPIIARNLGPFPEIIATSRAGLLFENRLELENAVHRVAGDSEFRRAAGAAAAQAFMRHWSETASMRAYFELIRRIAVSQNRPHVLDVLDQGRQSPAEQTGVDIS